MRLTRTVLPAVLSGVMLSGCGGSTTPAPTGGKVEGGRSAAKPTTTPTDPKTVEAARVFATNFLTAVRDKKASPDQLTPEYRKVFSETPVAELTFLSTEVAAEDVSVVIGPGGSAFVIGKSNGGAGRTLLRLVKSNSEFKVDWLSAGVKGVSDAALSGADAPSQFAAQVFLDAVLRKNYPHASALLTENARNTLGKSPFGGFDQGALKNHLDEMFGGVEKYVVAGTSTGSLTAELQQAGGKKTLTLKTVKGTRPGEWLVDVVEVN